jgi:hypothetical protein
MIFMAASLLWPIRQWLYRKMIRSIHLLKNSRRAPHSYGSRHRGKRLIRSVVSPNGRSVNWVCGPTASGRTGGAPASLP